MTVLRLVPDAFACAPLSRTVTPTECAGLARTAIGLRGPKVDRPCLGCPIGEAHMRGETLVRAETPTRGKTSPLLVELYGAMVSISEAARITKTDRRTVRWRMERGLPIDMPPTRGPTAKPVAVRGTPSPADVIRQLRAAGYEATPEVRDGRSVLVVAWPGDDAFRAADAATGREEAAE